MVKVNPELTTAEGRIRPGKYSAEAVPTGFSSRPVFPERENEAHRGGLSAKNNSPEHGWSIAAKDDK
jgi:hypothetical protein